ncbi:MAG: ATP-binding protein [Planctomycetota bacterium JB042]
MLRSGFTSSLRFRLAVAFGLLIAATAALMGLVLQQNAEANLLHHHRRTGSILARSIARNAELDLQARNIERLNELLAQLENEQIVRYATVFDIRGEILGLWYRNPEDVPESGKSLRASVVSPYRELEVNDEPITEFDVAIRRLSTPRTTPAPGRIGPPGPPGPGSIGPPRPGPTQRAISEALLSGPPRHRASRTETIGVVRLGLSRQPILDRLAMTNSDTIQLVLAAILAGAMASILMVRSFLRPLTRLVEATRRLGHGRFDDVTAEIPAKGEMRALANALDATAAALRRMRAELVDANGHLEQKVAERTQELQSALDELKVLDRMKDEFLSSVSHEFKTPLTSIRASAEILLQFQDESPETRAEFVDMILQESERLTRLVNDILDLVKIESGGLQWTLEDVDVLELAENALRQLRPFLDDHHLKATIVRRGAIPTIRGDRERIHQVIAHLLSNAIKFSHEGGSVEVTASVRGEAVLLAVRDHGIGIEPKDQQKIFDRFKQVGDTLTEKPPGTGLGLPISKNIIQRHGGTIWVESQIDKGSTFFFTLPLAGPCSGPTPLTDARGRTAGVESNPAPTETTLPGV